MKILVAACALALLPATASGTPTETDANSGLAEGWFTLGFSVSTTLLFFFTIAMILAIGIVVAALIEAALGLQKSVAIIAILSLVGVGWNTWLVIDAFETRPGEILIGFLAFLFMWAAMFHMIAWQYGHKLLSRFFGRHWVRGIDYIYLVGGITGLLVTVLKMTQGIDASAVPQRVAILVLGVAVALRITKTSAEIFKWDIPPANRT
jgi:hypothetical protein